MKRSPREKVAWAIVYTPNGRWFSQDRAYLLVTYARIFVFLTRTQFQRRVDLLSKHWSVHRNWTLIREFFSFLTLLVQIAAKKFYQVQLIARLSTSIRIFWGIFRIIIIQIFSFARDHDHVRHMTEYRQTGNVLEYSPIFKTARVAKNNWRIINTIASIWRGITLGHLSFDIICSSKLAVFLEVSSRKTVPFSEQTMSAGKYLRNIFVPNGGYCLYIRYLVLLYFVVVFLTIFLKQHNFIKFLSIITCFVIFSSHCKNKTPWLLVLLFVIKGTLDHPYYYYYYYYY